MHTREKGQKGEEISCRFLESKGFTIVVQNYQKKWGEIDIIAKKKGVLYFVEVKTRTANFYINGIDWYRPEDNVHNWKLRRLGNTIQVYLEEKGYGQEGEWQFDVVTVLLDVKNKLAKIRHIEDIIL